MPSTRQFEHEPRRAALGSMESSWKQIMHLLPQAEIAAKSFTQYQLGDSGNVGNFENGLGHAT